MAELFFIDLFLSKIIIIVQSFFYGNDLTIYSNLDLHMSLEFQKGNFRLAFACTMLNFVAQNINIVLDNNRNFN
jgi:hypothetical protein